MEPFNPIDVSWRQGRRNPQVIHAMLVKELPQDADPIIGMLNSTQLAKEAVDSHNAQLERRKHYATS